MTGESTRHLGARGPLSGPPDERTVVGVVGTGNMGSALVRGWLRTVTPATPVRDATPTDTTAPAVEVLAWDKIEAAAGQLRDLPGVKVAGSLEELVSKAAVVFVVVKPKDAEAVLKDVARARGRVVVSSMAGLSLSWMRERLGPGPALVRIMPNLGVASGAGAVAVVAEPGTPTSVLDAVLALLRPLGLVEVLPEDLFDVVTAISGSGPGFLALAVEGLEDGAVAAGMTRQAARRLVRQAALLAAQELPLHADSAAELRETRLPAGTPARRAVEVLEVRGVRAAFQQAVEAATQRSRRMRQS
jgi:pyrroline-5-carboxylate reductase